MNSFLRRAALTTLPAILFIGCVAGCAQIRQLTYPQDFTYLEKKEVKNLMKMMGDSVGRLGQFVAKDSASLLKQQQVVAELGKLEDITSRLSGGHKETNQIFISDHIEQFISDVGTAKMFAKTTPPNYSKAKEITNSCQVCHQSR